jgi:hypothetical protein
MVIKRRRQSDFDYPADQVWAAACAAYRINGGYQKVPEVTADVVRPSNRELVRLYLDHDTGQYVTDEDCRQGPLCRQTLKNSVTIQALKGELSEWNLLVARMTALDRVETEYELNVITAMIKSYHQTVTRENVDSRLAHCDDALVGRVNDCVTLQGEIAKCNYSVKFNTFYITVITAANQQVFFAYRERLDIERNIRFSGRVKRHADRATQLSRVKILEQEAV